MPTRKARLTRRIDKRALNQIWMPDRNELAFWLVTVLAVRVMPTALGLQPLPNSLLAAPYLLARLSTAILVLGCITVAVGIAWPRRLQGIPVELAGYIVLGWACIFYGVALAVANAPAAAAIASGLTFGLAVGCFARSVRIWLYVRGRTLASRRQPEEPM